jgi:hypothetical protein
MLSLLRRINATREVFFEESSAVRCLCLSAVLGLWVFNPTYVGESTYRRRHIQDYAIEMVSSFLFALLGISRRGDVSFSAIFDHLLAEI